jgi:hypothetical protein
VPQSGQQSWQLRDAAIELSRYRVGLAGVAKLGHATEVCWQARSTGGKQVGRWELQTRDGEGDPVIYADELVTELEEENPVTYTRIIRFGRLDASLTLRWIPTESSTSKPAAIELPLPRLLPSTSPLIVQCGDAIDLETAWPLVMRQAAETPILVQASDTETFPTTSRGWDGSDVVVLSADTEALFAQLSEAQWTALMDWVRFGGQILLAAGGGTTSLSEANVPLAKLIPGEVGGVRRQFETTHLEQFAGSQQRLDLLIDAPDRRQRGLAVTRLTRTTGTVEVAEQDGRELVPVVVRGTFGLGQVLFVAFDLGDPSMSQWSGFPRIVAKLLQLCGIESRVERDDSTGGQLSHLGFHDISGQFRAAMEQFPHVRLVPFGWIAILAVGYVLWIGPGDYYLLRRFGHRQRHTWKTFPLAVVAFSALFITLAARGQGTFAAFNQVDIVDIDLSSGTLRGSTWSHMHAPSTATWQVDYALAPSWSDRASTATALEWQGVPGEGFGGMDHRRTIDRGLPPYVLKNTPGNPAAAASAATFPIAATSAHQLMLPTGGTRAFRGRWHQQLELAPMPLEGTVAGYLEGAGRNPLSVPLRETRLLYGRWYYPLGDLAPDASFVITSTTKPKSMRNWLARREVVDGNDVVTPWDEADLNVPRVLEMLMFHERAGGFAYTGLTDRYQPWLDLSEHLACGQAILFGRLESMPTEWHWLADAPAVPGKEQWAFARIVIPVEVKGEDQRD